MQTRRVLAGLLIAALMSGACGDDDDEDAATGSSTTTTAAEDTTATTEATATTSAGASGPQGAKAMAAVVQRSDLPAAGGWKEQAPEDTPDHEPTWQALATCLGAGDLKKGEIGSATSPTYVTGLSQQVTATVAYLPPERVSAIATAFASDKFAGCAKTAITDDVGRNAPEGAEVVSVEVAPLDMPKLGDATTSYRATGMLTIGPGIQITVYTDLVAVFQGSSFSRLAFINGGPGATITPFPADLERSLVEKVATRAAA